MALPGDIIQEMFSSVVGHEARVPGSIASTSTYRFATQPNPDLSLALWSTGPESSPGDVSRRIILPLKTATASAIIGQERSIVRFMSNEITIGNLGWGEWIKMRILSKVRRDLGLDTRGGPGGETLVELTELMIIGDGGAVAAKWRPPSRQTGIAYMLVLLPSWFSGGDITFSHPGQTTTTFKPSSSSRSSYQVLSWFTDTIFTSAPIIKGNLCGLVYIIHHKESGPMSIPDLVPSAAILGTMTCFDARFRHVLRKWKQQLNQVAAMAQTADDDISEKPKLSYKMAFVNDTSFKTKDFVKLLTSRALEANFGAIHATLHFEESRHARPAIDRIPETGYYKTWQLHLDSGFSQPTSGLLQVGDESRLITPLQRIGGDLQELHTGIKEHGWAIDLLREVVGSIKDRKATRSLKIVRNWDSVDFVAGTGPVIFDYWVPVLVLFPLTHLHLLLEDVGLIEAPKAPIKNIDIYVDPDIEDIESEQDPLPKTPKKTRTLTSWFSPRGAIRKSPLEPLTSASTAKRTRLS